MGSTVALTGNDTFIINNRIFSDQADGDIVTITFPNDIATVKVGKNGNAMFGLNEAGRQADVMVKVVRGSSDDKFLLQLLNLQLDNFASTVLMIGEAVKKIGDGAGNIASDTFIFGGGVFVKPVEMKTNVEGDSEQSTSSYHMKFSKAARVIT